MWGDGVEEIKVLLVDDEMEYLDTLVKRLRKRRISATGVGSGESALEILEKEPVNIVLLDVKMPGMDGIQALREIKKRHPLIEVIMLTGHADMEVALEGMELGAFDYLMKPISIDELLYKLEDANQKRTIHSNKIMNVKEGLKKGDQ